MADYKCAICGLGIVKCDGHVSMWGEVDWECEGYVHDRNKAHFVNYPFRHVATITGMQSYGRAHPKKDGE